MENLLAGGEEDGYFWSRPKLYECEARIPVVNIPVCRALNTVIIIYTTYIGIDFIVGLCTYASQFSFSASLIACCSYWSWATWWDEKYVVPPTWSGIKAQRFHPVWVFIWLTYHAIMVALAVFLVIAAFVLTYADYRTAFEWQCWDN